ncbi:hypothetical protein [Rhodococcus sp. AQ5-07]|uniref:hypothetical protein n=1 Tax=Rhodococcus sp. AQ5-07 TaxID=2054902 RepID=UPI000DC0329F|nr:hypothetical protein [Rhodococcus sp. AQ5-07]RAL31149.1 hypothetical protein CVN56_29715 [Rhodococcus sp. AQ5-07]
MPAYDDFDGYEDDDVIDSDAVDYEEYEDEPEGGDDTDVRAAEKLLAAARAKSGNRSQRRAAAKVPASAPKPQDRKPKKSAKQSEAKDTTVLLTLWDEEIEIDRNALVDSWDWHLGTMEQNPLLLVRGLLGVQRFAWFTARAKGEGKTPMGAALEIIQMFSEEAGFSTPGN